MTLKYRIVWIDDSPTWVDSIKTEVVDHIAEQGLEADIELLTDGSTLVHKLGHDVDLFVVDYNLKGDNGDVLISRIRDAKVFTEIVFYSQDPDPTRLIGMTEGLFFCRRNSAAEKITDVIDLTLHKLKDIGVVRGLVIAAAIDLEVLIDGVLASLFDDRKELFRTQLLDRFYLDAGKKHVILMSVLGSIVSSSPDSDDGKEAAALRNVLKSFDQDILDQRNILAHSVPIYEEGRVVLKGINKRTKEIDFNPEWMSKTRSELKRHGANLEAIEKLLARFDFGNSEDG